MIAVLLLNATILITIGIVVAFHHPSNRIKIVNVQRSQSWLNFTMVFEVTGDKGYKLNNVDVDNAKYDFLGKAFFVGGNVTLSIPANLITHNPPALTINGNTDNLFVVDGEEYVLW